MSTIINATTTNGVVIQPDNSGSLVLQTNSGTTALTIDTSQRAAFVAGTAAAPAITTTGDTNTGMFFPAADTIAFAEGGVEAMRIDSSGNVGIGVTPSAWTSIDKAFEIGRAGNVIFSGGIDDVTVTSNTYYQNAWKYGSTGFANRFNVGSTNGSFQWFTAPSGTAGNTISFTQAMTLDSSGNLTITGATATKASGTTWANPSDIRLKDNVQDFNKGLTELLQVNVKTWEYNGKGGTVEGTKGIGVIADEIETVLPETVDTYKAKLNAEDTEDTDIKRFDATEITWLLVNAIKEQQTIINDLKARVETLEAK
jgi:hypothetical protein